MTPAPVVVPAPPAPPPPPPPPPPAVEAIPPAATPRPLDLATVAQTPALWPRQVTLLQPAAFPIVVNGRTAGSVTAPGGMAVRLLRVVGQQVEVEFQNGKQLLPAAATDLMPRATANFRAAPPSPAPAVVAVAVPAAQSGESPPPLLQPRPGQPPAPTVVPENLQPQFALIHTSYAKVDAAKRPKAPADSVWLFRSTDNATGTVEVGFQGAEVVYMIFRRGAGGASIKPEEIFRIHLGFHQKLLQETFSPLTGFSRYKHAVTAQINAAVIARKDFEIKLLMTGS